MARAATPGRAGQHDLPEDDAVPCPVRARRLYRDVRDAEHVLPQQKDPRGSEDTGQDDHSPAPQEAEPVGDDVVGHQGHPVGHEHGGDVHEQDGLPPSEPELGQGVGR